MINVISTHYGDDFYIKALISNLYDTKILPENTLYVVNNSIQDLVIEDKNIKILRFENNLVGSRQHAFGLNQCIRQLSEKESSSKLLILDSDVLLQLNVDWHQYFINLSEQFDATLAFEYGSNVLTHPCFMYLDGINSNDIDFLDGSYEFGFDTGRLIGYKLSKKYRVNKLFASRNKQIKLGDFYQNGSIFHLGSASLAYMPSRVTKNSITRMLGINLRKQIYLSMLEKFSISKGKKIQIFLVAITASMPFIFKSKLELIKVKLKNFK